MNSWFLFAIILVVWIYSESSTWLSRGKLKSLLKGGGMGKGKWMKRGIGICVIIVFTIITYIAYNYMKTPSSGSGIGLMIGSGTPPLTGSGTPVVQTNQDSGDACSSTPCGTGGTCSLAPSAPSGYSCSCNLGYSGTNCETADQADGACNPNPCINDGRCNLSLSAPPGYSCSCNLGYSGTNCETADQADADGPCTPNPCGIDGTGGICSSAPFMPLGFSCTCEQGYTGTQCDKADQVVQVVPANQVDQVVPGDACSSTPCGTGGTCSVSPSAPLGYSCACDAAHTGAQCETLTIPSPTNQDPGAPCIDDPGGHLLPTANCEFQLDNLQQRGDDCSYISHWGTSDVIQPLSAICPATCEMCP